MEKRKIQAEIDSYQTKTPKALEMQRKAARYLPGGSSRGTAYFDPYPHFIERGTVRTINDPIAGEFAIPGMPIKTSVYPANNDFVAPTLGQNNSEILQTILGKTEEEISSLASKGVLHSAAS